MPLSDLRGRARNHQDDKGTPTMMLDITERICSACPVRRQSQSPLANANVRRKPNRKWATQWARLGNFQTYSMKTAAAGGDGAHHIKPLIARKTVTFSTLTGTIPWTIPWRKNLPIVGPNAGPELNTKWRRGRQ